MMELFPPDPAENLLPCDGVVKNATQAHWLHSIPKSTKVTAPRINLTPRKLTP